MRNLNRNHILTLLEDLLDNLPNHWQRRRVQGPRSILATLLVLAIDRGVSSTRRALVLLRDMYPSRGRERQEPCPAAFCRARRKMKEPVLRTLFANLVEAAESHNPRHRVNGYRLIAIDGSQILLPRSPSTLKEFGSYSHNKPSHQPQSRLVVAWDVLARRPVDWITGTCFESEREAAIQMAPRLPAKSIVLLDRGFHGLAAIEAFTRAKIGCFMRIRSGKTTWIDVQRFLLGKSNDALVTLTGCVDGETVNVRYRVVKTTRIDVRRGKIETVVFLTNLTDRKAWPRRLLLKLYSLRWDIETAFRELKIQDRVEGFHTTTADGIRQEIAAFMIARLLAGALLNQVEMAASHRLMEWDHPRKSVFNNCSLVHATCDVLTAFVLRHQNPVILELLAAHLQAINDSAQRRRPERSYIRKCRGRYGRWKGTKNHRFQLGRNSQLHLQIG